MNHNLIALGEKKNQFFFVSIMKFINLKALAIEIDINTLVNSLKFVRVASTFYYFLSHINNCIKKIQQYFTILDFFNWQ